MENLNETLVQHMNLQAELMAVDLTLQLVVTVIAFFLLLIGVNLMRDRR